MSRRHYAEIQRKIERLKEIADEYNADDRPDPLTAEEKAALDEMFDVDPWADNPEVEAAVRDLHAQAESE
jgi:hypothetical protein